ncbi:hypothetical protein PTTG_27105 [Puccinia triticina 1-1 BBBD Race 1]|uniref:HAT C-terminal dimerisation domain-containing protein n=1 Tax=Puccinia triticina (isolate 1-1 / race 1 (BBBD)) TaxID=630390 RepID=A0A180GQC5_PUCT1|nr:hypothetical protein PTTG_27105 [Puccinia triticina 1-1 BBBD Race 1]
MPLDFLRLSQRHTGEYLAKTVALVADKFGIQDWICGLVSNNAKNNKVMVKELKKLKWTRFRGETHWIRCFAHILNLIVQAILRPFGTQKRKKSANGSANSADFDSDESQFEDGDAEEQIQVFSRTGGDHSTSLLDGDSDEHSELQSLPGQDDDENDSLTEADIGQASEEDKGDYYTTNTCKLTLAKFRQIAKKLRYSPNSKAEFIDICQEKECHTPHNVERDVRTRWNSTFYQMKSIIWCEAAVLEWQRHKQHGLERKHHVDQSDIKLASDLVNVLGIFHDLTLQVSNAGSARLSNIVIYIDQITKHLLTIISDQKYPPALRNACRHGLKITNKYYSLTDTSPLYRIAILMHPSFKDEYFKLAKWEPEWIAKAIRLAREMWDSFYKLKKPTHCLTAPASTSKPRNNMLAGLGDAAAARSGNCSTDAFDDWLAGGLILDGNKPVNPIKWWLHQKSSGSMDGGLINMALDILSCTATSVDVEIAFSFDQDYISLKRHRLGAHSISRGMTVAFYSKNNMIEEGVLASWKEQILDSNKTSKKSKRKTIVVDDD